MMADNDSLQLSRNEIFERIERGAQHRLGLSAEEFVNAYRAGKLRECGGVADLLALAQLLTKDNPLFVAA